MQTGTSVSLKYHFWGGLIQGLKGLIQGVQGLIQGLIQGCHGCHEDCFIWSASIVGQVCF